MTAICPSHMSLWCRSTIVQHIPCCTVYLSSFLPYEGYHYQQTFHLWSQIRARIKHSSIHPKIHTVLMGITLWGHRTNRYSVCDIMILIYSVFGGNWCIIAERIHHQQHWKLWVPLRKSLRTNKLDLIIQFPDATWQLEAEGLTLYGYGIYIRRFSLDTAPFPP